MGLKANCAFEKMMYCNRYNDMFLPNIFGLEIIIIPYRFSVRDCSLHGLCPSDLVRLVGWAYLFLDISDLCHGSNKQCELGLINYIAKVQCMNCYILKLLFQKQVCSV